MKAMILSKPAMTIEVIPACAKEAPTSPPTRVWDELDGRPHHQVSRFQVIAATSAPDITVILRTAGSTTPFPIVCATFRGKTVKAIKLKNAARATAMKGESTLVETTQAIELAESWNPFRKSNTRTSPITTYKTSILKL